MSMSHAQIHRSDRNQAGYAYMVVLLMLSLLVISLTALVPNWKTSIQRDREQQSIDRARQYAMGVRRYYHKFGSYPPSMDRLKETNGMRFLRKEWPDPLTPEGEWRILHVGDFQRSGPQVGKTVGDINAEAHSSNASQASGSNGGQGAAGNNSDDSDDEDAGSAASSNSATQSNPASSGSAFGASPAGASSSGFGFGQGSTSAFGASPAQGTGPGFGRAGSFGPMNGPGAGPMFGGGGIIGVASKDKKIAIHEINKKRRPSQWRIVYDPSQEIIGAMGGMMAPAQNQPGFLNNSPQPGQPLTPQTPPQPPNTPGTPNQ
jgi:type II secretory pathway pseudopilin PulG